MTLILILVAFGLCMALGVATLPAATALTRAGVLVSGALPTAATTADKFANNGKQYLLFRNGDSASHTITLVTPIVAADQAGNLTVQDPTVVVAAGETRILGPFKPSIFNDSQGYVNYTLDAATSCTVQVVSASNEAANS